MDTNPTDPPTFTSKDLEKYLENIRAAHLQAVTWSATVEVEGHFTYPPVEATQAHKLKRPKTTYDDGSSPSI